LDRGLKQLAEQHNEARMRALLVAAHQPAIPRDVGAQDRDQLAFQPAISEILPSLDGVTMSIGSVRSGAIGPRQSQNSARVSPRLRRNRLGFGIGARSVVQLN